MFDEYTRMNTRVAPLKLKSTHYWPARALKTVALSSTSEHETKT